MKFIHTADIHLGAEPDAGSSYTAKRPEELWNSFERLLNICEEEQTDLLLIAGTGLFIFQTDTYTGRADSGQP